MVSVPVKLVLLVNAFPPIVVTLAGISGNCLGDEGLPPSILNIVVRSSLNKKRSGPCVVGGSVVGGAVVGGAVVGGAVVGGAVVGGAVVGGGGATIGAELLDTLANATCCAAVILVFLALPLFNALTRPLVWALDFTMLVKPEASNIFGILYFTHNFAGRILPLIKISD
jgi:hypothetical protein